MLTDGKDPETWLTGPGSTTSTAAGQPMAWLEDDHPLIRRLKGMRDESALRSPVGDRGARAERGSTFVGSSPPGAPTMCVAAQRQKNLDAFLALAVEYEKHAAAHHEPGTLTGLLFWLEHPSSPDLDLAARRDVRRRGARADVPPRHRDSSGPSWCAPISSTRNGCARGMSGSSRAPVSDIADPLVGRELRYWPNLFGRRRRGVPARAAIEESDEGERCRAKTRAEQQRLAYVGHDARLGTRLVLAMSAQALRRDAWYPQLHAGFRRAYR